MRIWLTGFLILLGAFTCEADGLPVGLDGQELDVFADADSDTLVLLFVEDICPISNRYIPKMKRFESEWSEKGVRFFMVYPNISTTVEHVGEHRKDFEVDIDCVIDRDHVLVGKADATVTPECAVFAKDHSSEFQLVYRGRIDNQYVAFGKWRKEATRHDLRDTLESLATGERPPFRSERAIGCYIDRD